MDKYEVIGLLGEGSFGRVYKAKQLQNGTFVALKVISKVKKLYILQYRYIHVKNDFREAVLRKN